MKIFFPKFDYLKIYSFQCFFILILTSSCLRIDKLNLMFTVNENRIKIIKQNI